MKPLFENWRKFLKEDSSPNKVWFIGGPEAVGKTTLASRLQQKAPPSLVVQDLDQIPDVAQALKDYRQVTDSASWEEAFVEENSAIIKSAKENTEKINIALQKFFDKHQGKDIYLTGVAWLRPLREPFNLPPNCKKSYLWREPDDIIASKLNREEKSKSLSPEKRSKVLKDIEKDFTLYDDLKWERLALDESKNLNGDFR